jgi:hypothetical protein
MTHTFQTRFKDFDEVNEYKARHGYYTQGEKSIQLEIERRRKLYTTAKAKQGYAIIAAMDGLVTVIIGTNEQVSGGMGHDLHELAFHAGLPVADYRDADREQLMQILSLPYVACKDKAGEWEAENGLMPRISSTDFIEKLKKIGVTIYQRD